jgi:hypothetical protein
VLEWLCKKLSAGGRLLDPLQHDLFIIAPGNQTLRERKLQREDLPFQIQANGGTAFKFLFREVAQIQAPPGGEGAVSSELSTDGQVVPTKEESGVVSTDASATFVNAAAVVPSPTVVIPSPTEGLLKSGVLDRQLEDGTWQPSQVILDEDRLWYSSPSGGGMMSLPLRECDRVVDGEDKKLLQLLTKGGPMTLRAKNSNEKTAWLLAVVKQAAFIKERDILLQAETIISGMESRRASQQLERLKTFNKLSGVMATRESRDLLLDFARSEWEAVDSASPQNLQAFLGLDDSTPVCDNAIKEPAKYGDGAGSNSRWPQGLTLKALSDSIERRAAGIDVDGANAQVDSLAWAFVEETLFPKFLEHPTVQCRICRIAAGIH